jgi:hypothetical protein
MTDAPMPRGQRMAAAPAIKVCRRCSKPEIDLRKRSSYGIGYDGTLLCKRCIHRLAPLAANAGPRGPV